MGYQGNSSRSTAAHGPDGTFCIVLWGEFGIEA